MYLHRDAKIAYLAHPRTASTATCVGLKEQADFEPSHQHHATPVEAREKWPGIHGHIDFADDWIICCTVRNHYETFRSEFLNTNYHEVDNPEITPEVLEMMLDTSIYWRDEGESPFRQLFYHVPFCTTVIRYEYLNKRLNFILKSRDLDEIEIPSKNVSDQTDKPYTELFTDEGREWVRNNYAIEMKRYSFNW